MDDWNLNPARDFGMPLGQRLRSPRREPGLIETGAHLAWASLIRAYLKLCHRLRVEGRENVPSDGPFILASNHASHLDALVLASVLPHRLRDRIFPVAAGDTFFETPLLTAFAGGVLNALPLSRHGTGRHALDELRTKLLEDRCVYILFPEGTRSRDGSIGKFKAGIGMLVAGTNVPVIPCHLEGTFAALPPGKTCPRCRRIDLRMAPPLLFAEQPNDRSGWDQITTELQRCVRVLADQTSL